MIIVDSFGWIEYLADTPLASKYEKYLSDLSQIITPSIVVYEVYKKIQITKGEEKALLVIGQMTKTEIIPLDTEIALSAADISLKYSLPMADAIVYATGIIKNCSIATSDSHFKNLDRVIFISR
ncbi:MAG: type II toxin-antitoxin system VapC family toxin [Cyanobacteria bacterium]|nr:type II toxin-antitoxin system VapC family toxin [Cyanobacteriota bacterium]